MSVNQDSMANSGLMSSDHDAPDLEYVAVRQDSLTMFGAAIGGAILGMLLTLLVLAILNSGTLRFVGGSSRLGQVETAYNQLSDNVGRNTTNIETLSENMNEQVLVMNTRIDDQNLDIDGINGAVSDLDSSRGQFNTLVDALSGAISNIKGTDAGTAGDAGTADGASGADTSATTEAAAEGSDADASASGEASVAAGTGALNVLFFSDANGNQAQDAGEENLLGISVSLLDAAGEAVATLESTDGGMTFDGLAAGDYTLMVEDAGDYPLENDELGMVSVTDDGEQTVFIAVGSE